MLLPGSLYLVALALFAGPAPQTSTEAQLPALHKLVRVTLGPTYSCRSAEESSKGYQQTALFLTPAGKQINRPDLLFNGACKSPDQFDVQLAGDNFDVIADYGDIPLEDLAAENLFSLLRRTDSVTVFTSRAPVRAGHTYAVLLNKDSERGFFYFKVLAYTPNQSVDLEYVVMDYKVLRVEAQSRGFSWDAKPEHEQKPCTTMPASDFGKPR